MMLLLAFLSLCVAALAQNECETNRLNAVKSGDQLVRGVNLGSWFVLESWISPQPWDDGPCEKYYQWGSYLVEQCLGDRAQEVMQRHWSTWITEDDFAELSRNGVNVVRIPVGWWQIYDTEGGVQDANLNWNIDPAYRKYTAGALEYLDKAFDWADNHGIGIIIDMHAAPGSQNGNEYSSPTEVPGNINWDKSQENVGQTIDSMGLYADRYATRKSLYGFALLNEPLSVDLGVLQDYYHRVYDRIKTSVPDAWILLNPRIYPLDYGTEPDWTGFMNPDQGYDRVAMDLHFYSCFGGDPDKDNADDAIAYIRQERQRQIDDYARLNPKKFFIGEWSACGHFPNDRDEEFTQVQADVYNTASLGWTFWTWRIDTPDNEFWSFKYVFDQGWIDPIYPC